MLYVTPRMNFKRDNSATRPFQVFFKFGHGHVKRSRTSYYTFNQTTHYFHRLSGEWDLLGVRSDGAGGRNWTERLPVAFAWLAAALEWPRV